MEQLTTLAEVATQWSHRSPAPRATCPTGFKALDSHLGGGLRPGSLTLVAGPPGLGKSTLALQVARNAAAAGLPVLVSSHEHGPEDLLARLLSMEAGELDDADQARLGRVQAALDGEGAAAPDRDVASRLDAVPQGRAALERFHRYADLVVVHRTAGGRDALEDLRSAAQRTARDRGRPPLVVVDHLQSLDRSRTGTDDERSLQVAEALKALAGDLGLAVVATVSAGAHGPAPGTRMRSHHMRGGSLLAQEADLVLVLNDKYDVVARHHLTYAGNAERFHDWVVVSVEKNRHGPDHVDVELRQRLDQGRFEPGGQAVAEQLVDDRVFTD